MTIQLICCSHSPLMLKDLPPSQAGDQTAFFDEMARVANAVRAFDPELVVVFGPDHFNGFFFDLMPPFCIGAAAQASKDWGIEGGPLRVRADLAQACVRALYQRQIDPAYSHDMRIDHGISIPLVQLTGSLARYDSLPVFINCAGDPRPTMQRCWEFGEAVGTFLAQTGLRITFIGSGGLSHDPPTPRLTSSPPDVARRLIQRHQASTDELDAREKRVMQAAHDLVEGKGPCMPPKPDWDLQFLDKLCRNDKQALTAITDEELNREAGFGGHEVRTWVAALAAAQQCGDLTLHQRFYRVVPEWLTGMGIVTSFKD